MLCFLRLCFVTAAAVALATVAVVGAWDTFDFDHESNLDGNGHYDLFWNVLSDTEIEFALRVKSSGWVGFGISPGGGMPGSDIVLGWIADDDDDENRGGVVLQNRYATTMDTPVLMADQSGIELISGSAIDGMTYLRFKRLLHPCDDHSVDIAIGVQHVIFAWNDEPPAADSGEPGYHGVHRGQKSINLLSGESNEVEMPAVYHTYDVVFDDVEIPTEETSYYCKLLALPALEEVHHIIRIDPIITAGNEAVVHHILLFICPDQYFNATADVGTGGLCSEWPNMGFRPSVCLQGTIFGGWAVGGMDFYFPEHVGYEVGGDASDAFTHTVMQMHYDNPTHIPGLRDSSGLKMYYTPTLRKYSASVIGISSSNSGIVVPAHMPPFHLNGYCVPECTDEWPAEGVHVFANTLHAHLLGQSLKLRHIRNGIELQFLDINAAYDFNLQQRKILHEEILLLPGDVLMIDCEFDASARDWITFGGEGTREEMCISFVTVYPKVDMTWCQTAFAAGYLEEWWTTAVENGYSSNSLPVDMARFEDDLEYDASTVAAQEYYTQIWQEKRRSFACKTGPNLATDWKLGINDDIPIAAQDFVEYEIPDLSDCSNSPSGKSSSEFRIESKWYFWLGTVVIVVLVVLLLVYCVCTRRQRIHKVNVGQASYLTVLTCSGSDATPAATNTNEQQNGGQSSDQNAVEGYQTKI